MSKVCFSCQAAVSNVMLQTQQGGFSNATELRLTTLNARYPPLSFTGDVTGAPYIPVTSLLGPFVDRHFLFRVCLSFKVSNITPCTPATELMLGRGTLNNAF